MFSGKKLMNFRDLVLGKLYEVIDSDYLTVARINRRPTTMCGVSSECWTHIGTLMVFLGPVETRTTSSRFLLPDGSTITLSDDFVATCLRKATASS